MPQPPHDNEQEQEMMWDEFRREIDRRLDERRPQRAGVGDRDWREPVYGWARNHMPDESNLVRRIAEREVDRRESEATKRGNNLIRDWMHGRAPLAWSLVGPLPVRVGKLRVRLDVATPTEVEDAARELLRAAKLTYDEVRLLHDGLLDLGQQARTRGLLTVALIGDQPPRVQTDSA